MSVATFAASPDPGSLLTDARARALALEQRTAGVVIGQARSIRLINIALHARGHVLLQGDVGVGKTTLLKAFARQIGGGFERIEGTIDLMPADLLYHTYIGPDGRPAVEAGPLVADAENLAVFFFNEINRARPQVHSLLLRAMAERSVRAFNRELRLPHLLVFADRNRVEREETFEISSAARDRFLFEVGIEVPQDDAARGRLAFDPAFHDADAMIEALPAAAIDHRSLTSLAAAVQREISVSPALERYALALWRATERPHQFGVRMAWGPRDGVDEGLSVEGLVLAGASPRGMSLLMRAARVAAWLEGRDHVLPEDVRDLFLEAVAHRLVLQPVYELRRQELLGPLVRGITEAVAAP